MSGLIGQPLTLVRVMLITFLAGTQGTVIKSCATKQANGVVVMVIIDDW